MRTLVMKFGGTSVGMTMGLTQLLSIVLNEHQRWDRLLLVVSALEGVTDSLLEAARLAQLANRRGYRRIVGTVRSRHMALIEHLPLGANERAALQADLDRLLFDLLDVCQGLADRQDETRRPEAFDSILATGERLAARIVAALLRQSGLRSVAIDATEIIVTDSVFGNATPDIGRTRDRIERMLLPMLDRHIIPVVTGFIGSTPSGKTTTLGRGGSDYSASLAAICTDANEVWFWTDVDGIMSADPRDIDAARAAAQLTYTEAAELAYFGARLLHTRTIAPLQDRRIPLRVRNVFKPQGAGTLISEAADGGPALKSVTMIHGLGMTAAHSGAPIAVMSAVDDALFRVSGAHAEVVLSAQSSWQTLLAFVIPTSAGPDALHALQNALESRAEADAALARWSARPVAIITVVGTHLEMLHQRLAALIAALEGIALLAISPSPSGSSFSLVVEVDDADSALQRVHSVVVAQ